MKITPKTFKCYFLMEFLYLPPLRTNFKNTKSMNRFQKYEEYVAPLPKYIYTNNRGLSNCPGCRHSNSNERTAGCMGQKGRQGGLVRKD